MPKSVHYVKQTKTDTYTPDPAIFNRSNIINYTKCSTHQLIPYFMNCLRFDHIHGQFVPFSPRDCSGNRGRCGRKKSEPFTVWCGSACAVYWSTFTAMLLITRPNFSVYAHASRVPFDETNFRASIGREWESLNSLLRLWLRYTNV